MKRTRDNRTPLFAAAFYACACLLVYGTAAAAHAHHPTGEAAASPRQQQSCCTGQTAGDERTRDCSPVAQAARSSLFFGAMLSAIVAAEPNPPQQFEDARSPLPLHERHAVRPSILSSAAHCALLSRQLADA